MLDRLLLLIALDQHTIVLVLAWCGVGATGAVSGVTLAMARVRAVPDAALGRLVAASSLITEGAVPVGALAGGYLLQSYGPVVTSWIVFAALVPVTLICTAAAPRTGIPR